MLAHYMDSPLALWILQIFVCFSSLEICCGVTIVVFCSLRLKVQTAWCVQIILSLSQYTTDWILKKRGYERDEFLFRTVVIKISKIKFTQFLHTSSSKFLLKTLPIYCLLQPKAVLLSFIVPLGSKILVLFGWDLGAGNSKFLRPKIPARSALSIHFNVH